MATARSSHLDTKPSLAFVLLCILLATIWCVGGASRADALGQAVVRIVACGTLAVTALWGKVPDWRNSRAPFFLLLLAIALVLAQLVPLPPEVWQALPGRTILSQAAVIAGEPQPWRPIAIVPDAAVNAAFSLVVPLAVMVSAAGLEARERPKLPGMLLLLIISSVLVGLLQASGAMFDLPLINGTPGSVSGTFANRNHFALLLAIGCLVAPVWAFPAERRQRWRLPIALGLIPIFVLTILATGSRTGMLVGAIALVLGGLLVRKGLWREFRRAPRWVFPATLAGMFAIIAIFVLMSAALDRAVSIQRFFALDAAQDIRARALPTVLSMVGTYFPMGSGFGGFDTLFRAHEPFGLLQPIYLNQAHNDFLEIALDGGLAGILLLVGAILWWLAASVKAWCSGSGPARLGSSILLLILVASLSDYPARTPIMMAVLVLAGIWLSGGRTSPESPTLPANG